MAKFYGKIGYVLTEETKPGVWAPVVKEYNYSGDTVRTASRYNQSNVSTNDNMTVDVQISIISDPFANENFQKMRYIEYMNCLWEIIKVEVQYPRLVITVGGVYNGKQANTASKT